MYIYKVYLNNLLHKSIHFNRINYVVINYEICM